MNPPSVLHRLEGTRCHRRVIDGQGIIVAHGNGFQLAAIGAHRARVITANNICEYSVKLFVGFDIHTYTRPVAYLVSRRGQA